jgi:hypothetical protein
MYCPYVCITLVNTTKIHTSTYSEIPEGCKVLVIALGKSMASLAWVTAHVASFVVSEFLLLM